MTERQNSILAVKGIEDGIISDEALQDFEKRVGMELRVNNIFNELASKDAIRKFADGIGDENPLWRDESYANQSPYRGIAAPPSWLNSVFPTWVLQGLKGVHAIHASTEWEFYRPVYLNDTIRPECYFSGFEVKNSSFAGRTVIERQEARYYNQNGELVAVARPVGFRTERRATRENKLYMDIQLPHPWTEQELAQIEDQILKEEIRGSKLRFWEDTEPGDLLPPIAKGPLGLTDVIAYCIGAAPVAIKAHASSLKIYGQHPAWCFRDPYSFALEPIYGVHYNQMAAQDCGLPYPYDIGVQRHCWLIQLLTNWMGDYGWLKRNYAKYAKFVFFSDVVKLSGKVVRKYRDDEGEYCVDIATKAINQRGEDVMPGTATIVLPRKRNLLCALEKRLRSV
ncbi:MaoC family dehydratase N-terminal domain-containing protein [Dehalobacter sp. DCM]|uniref:FAS1-like dehydratase domain-containing protein n=1 Tax=Dehalobacter sp. DCM TaxID=2907827 RepID=UPI003082064C|nr:MaoC family dehydratase N-terminal domain-containing protein [Dehalobacter sp. DCM]